MPPLHLLIKPASSLCNMRCQYCFYADVAQNRDVPSYGMMSAETLETLVMTALAQAEGSCAFAFQGGEPTLAGLDFFKALIVLQQKHNTKRLTIHNSIQTNGLLIDDEWARFLHEHNFLVGLSLDGDAATHNALRLDPAGKGTYNRVSRAATLLQKHGVEYNILCVVTSDIAQHGARVYNQLKRHRYLQFIPCIDDFGSTPGPLSLTPALYLRFLKTTFDLYYHDYMHGQYVSIRAFDNYVQLLLGRPPENCAMHGVCTCNLVVEGDGSVYPCDFYVLDAWRLGNIHEDALPDMLASNRAKLFVQDSLPVEDACQACRWYALCRGGCRRDRELPGQDGLSLNRFCEAYKAFFEYSYDRMAEIAQRVAYGG